MFICIFIYISAGKNVCTRKLESRVLKCFVSFVKKFIIPTKCEIVLYGNK